MVFRSNHFIALISTTCLLGLSACNEGGSQNGASGQVLGTDVVAHTPISIPSDSNNSDQSSSTDSASSVNPSTSNPNPDAADPTDPILTAPTSTPSPSASPVATPTASPAPTPTTSPAPTPSPTSTTVGSSCHSSNSDILCTGLKYVVYTDSKKKPVVTQSQAISNLTVMNKIFAQCQIAFQIDEFLAVDPTLYNLTFNTANDYELDNIRKVFDDSTHLLVVTTGTWNRNGSLGNTGANAWANMPGDSDMGAILEAAVGTYSNIITHEIGHYLNLDHANDSSNLMNPVIYDTSTGLTASQCREARNTINVYWKRMIR